MHTDIKTPLSVIISNASLLNDSELDTQSKKHIPPILTESYYIQNILNDLNIVARLSSGHLQLNQTETKIIPFFKDILIHILNQEIWNDFEFEFDYDDSLVNQSIMIEQFLITRVIHNIIYNSVLHNEKGCTIRIHLFKKDTNVIVEIKDNGQGASPEKIAELNELSFKNIDISKIRTTGIGLKISKQIVDLHQGSISFASVQNEFFESIISLPIFNITN
ncbi:MAG: sensor histidine kinase [Streptococcus sp.]